jgi:hypothetical protein
MAYGRITTPFIVEGRHSCRARDRTAGGCRHLLHEFTTNEFCTHNTIHDRRSPTSPREAAMGDNSPSLCPLTKQVADGVRRSSEILRGRGRSCQKGLLAFALEATEKRHSPYIRYSAFPSGCSMSAEQNAGGHNKAHSGAA